MADTLNDEQKSRLEKVMESFGLKTLFTEEVLFVKGSNGFEIFFTHATKIIKPEELEYWFYHLDLRGVELFKVGEIRGFIDPFKNRYDIICRLSDDVFILLSRTRDYDGVYEKDKQVIDSLKKTLQEIINL